MLIPPQSGLQITLLLCKDCESGYQLHSILAYNMACDLFYEDGYKMPMLDEI
jgi:hypothetical protein